MAPDDSGKGRLLLVENHEAFARVVTQQFLADYDVDLVTSLQGALAALKADPNYDYILADYDLDDGKGDELVRAASQLAPTARVVEISAHDTGNLRLREAGAVSICAKRDFAQIGEILARLRTDHRLHDAILGALLGCTLGDALGSVVEGARHSPRLVEQVERRAAAPAHGDTRTTRRWRSVSRSRSLLAVDSTKTISSACCETTAIRQEGMEGDASCSGISG